MNKVSFTGVVAMAKDRGIGYRGELPWHLPDDLKTFKRITMGHPILMGRKTFESIGKALPGRQNIVLTRDVSWQADGVEVIHSIDEIAGLALQDSEVMIIGGAEIFALFLPLMGKMWVSHVQDEYPADTFLPEFEAYLPHAHLEEKFTGFDLYLHTK